MRDIDPALKAHLEEGATTTCHCWIVKREDGLVLGFTDHDEDILIENIHCIATSGFQPTEAASELGLAAANQEIEGILSSEAITEDDLDVGRYDNAKVEVWLVNWNTPEQRSLLRTLIIGEISREDELFRAELRGLSSLLEQRTGRSYSKQCDAVLGDAKCGIDLTQAQYMTSGSITEIVDRLTFRCLGLDGFEMNWFAGGVIRFTSGRNQGLAFEISASAETQINDLTLWKAAPLPIEVGDTFELTTGCNKHFSTCRNKFANHLNFRGCPHIPGSDFALSYAKTGVIHDGSPLIK